MSEKENRKPGYEATLIPPIKLLVASYLLFEIAALS